MLLLLDFFDFILFSLVGGEWGGRDGGEKKLLERVAEPSERNGCGHPTKTPQVSHPTRPFQAVAGAQHEVVAGSRIKWEFSTKQTSLELQVHRFVFV